MPTFVGIDLSLTGTGLSVDGDLYLIASKLTGVERLIDIRNRIIDHLANTTQRLYICIEGYSFGSRNSHAHALGELGGTVRVALHEHGYGYVDVAPTCRAKFATGKGNAGKSEVVSAISARTGIIWSGKGADDLCDAWVLEEMCRTHFGESRYEWPQANLSALSKIDWSPFLT